jgi:hypothetical protein
MFLRWAQIRAGHRPHALPCLCPLYDPDIVRAVLAFLIASRELAVLRWQLKPIVGVRAGRL